MHQEQKFLSTESSNRKTVRLHTFCWYSSSLRALGLTKRPTHCHRVPHDSPLKALTQQVIHDSLQLTQHFRLGLDYPARYTGVWHAPSPSWRLPTLTQRSPVLRGAARRHSLIGTTCRVIFSYDAYSIFRPCPLGLPALTQGRPP